MVVSLVAGTGTNIQASVVAEHGLSCSATCGVFLDQGWYLCPLHWQIDSKTLDHQGSPKTICLC